MLVVVKANSVGDFFTGVPRKHRFPNIDLDPGKSELILTRDYDRMAARNVTIDEMPSFLGGGSYNHFIPTAIGRVAGRSEFFTNYTPYQPEGSQGTLEVIYVRQTMLANLTGMDISNAGLYSGAAAGGEAVLMARRITKKDKVVIASSVAPNLSEVIETYCYGPDIKVRSATLENARDQLEGAACVFVQQPNAFGYIEDLETWGKIAHEAGALFVVSVDPIQASFYRPPGDFDADIVVGEGQSLGNQPNFGGPYFGIFTTRRQFVHEVPGRIVGRTKDESGRTGYVLVLPAREQHIRKEKAKSNITTSAEWIGLKAALYLSMMGPDGIRKAAELSYQKAHYAANKIAELEGYSLPIEGEFFKEFVIECPIEPEEVNKRLLAKGILGGIDVGERIPRGLMLCCTEMNSREDIDLLIESLAEISYEERKVAA